MADTELRECDFIEQNQRENMRQDEETADAAEIILPEEEGWRSRHDEREERKNLTRERIRNASAGDAVLIKADQLSLDIDNM